MSLRTRYQCRIPDGPIVGAAFTSMLVQGGCAVTQRSGLEGRSHSGKESDSVNVKVPLQRPACSHTLNTTNPFQPSLSPRSRPRAHPAYRLKP